MTPLVQGQSDVKNERAGGTGIVGVQGLVSVVEEASLKEAVVASVTNALDDEFRGNELADREAKDRVAAKVLANLGAALVESRTSPELVTAKELFEYVRRIASDAHEGLHEKEVRELADALAKLNRMEDPLVYSRAMLKENAELRAEFFEDWPCYTSRDLTELAGHSAKNSSATANRWRNTRKIFGLTTADGVLYPAFQFTQTEPHPSIAAVLGILPTRMTSWEIAFWFASPNPFLDGAVPAEMLANVEELKAAAHYEVERIIG